MKPPRALWVPFELGRPLGLPNDPAFQRKVLIAVLKLLESPSGPVLEDFPEDAHAPEETPTPWACPVNFEEETVDLNSTAGLRGAFKREMTQLRPWYELAVRRRGRTTVGVSGVDLEAIADFIGAFLDAGRPENPRGSLPLGLVLRLAVDDLKAYYTEAVAAQPGRNSPGSRQLADWFWKETFAAKVLVAVKESCTHSDDEMLRVVGQRLLVPLSQTHRTA